MYLPDLPGQVHGLRFDSHETTEARRTTTLTHTGETASVGEYRADPQRNWPTSGTTETSTARAGEAAVERATCTSSSDSLLTP